MLVYTGYLTLSKRGKAGVHEFRIPNAEVRRCFTENISGYYADGGIGPYSGCIKEFISHLLSGNAAPAGKTLNKLLRGFVSVRDAATKSPPENFCQGFVSGLFAAATTEGLVSDYHPNRESGEGYADATFMAADQDLGVVLELKQASDASTLRRVARQAAEQIESKDYARSLREDGAARVLACGIAFCRRQCAIIICELKF